MAIERRHFAKTFTEFPAWRCSQCDGGTLVIVPNTLRRHEEPWSRAAHSEEAWEPDWIREVFFAALDCQACRRSTVMSGTSEVTEHMTFDGPELGQVYTPRTFTHAPAIFPLSKNLPGPVNDQLVRAFSHFWNDPDACGSAIRRCVEAMLADAKVKRTTIANGKRRDLALHNRIEHHTKGKLAQVKDRLIAIKWVGNDTTHFSAEAKSRSELLDAFELLQSVLHAVYDDRTAELDKLAAKITKRKGKSPKAKAKV